MKKPMNKPAKQPKTPFMMSPSGKAGAPDMKIRKKPIKGC